MQKWCTNATHVYKLSVDLTVVTQISKNITGYGVLWNFPSESVQRTVHDEKWPCIRPAGYYELDKRLRSGRVTRFVDIEVEPNYTRSHIQWSGHVWIDVTVPIGTRNIGGGGGKRARRKQKRTNGNWISIENLDTNIWPCVCGAIGLRRIYLIGVC